MATAITAEELNKKHSKALKALKQLLGARANFDKLTGVIAAVRAHHGLQTSPSDLEGLFQLAINDAARSIHEAMVYLKAQPMVPRFKRGQKELRKSWVLTLKSSPTRKRQLDRLVESAHQALSHEDSLEDWGKAWRSITIALRNELEGAYRSRLQNKSIGQHKAPLVSTGMFGKAPAPELVLLLIDYVRGLAIGGRPCNCQLHGTIALILDEGQYLSQSKSWGIYQGGISNLDMHGARLVAEVFDEYEFGYQLRCSETHIKLDYLDRARPFRKMRMNLEGFVEEVRSNASHQADNTHGALKYSNTCYASAYCLLRR